MLQPIRRIGNSQGVILPRTFLQQAGISDQVDMQVIDGAIILRPGQAHPRQGWDEAFQKAQEEGHLPENDLFDGAGNEFDKAEWTW